MKRTILTFILASLMILTVACSSGKYTDGTYSKEASGNGGKMTVEVRISGGKITEINVLDNQETPAMLTSVKETLIPQIITEQTVEGVDTVSGATNSSNAVLDAVGQSLTEATK